MKLAKLNRADVKQKHAGFPVVKVKARENSSSMYSLIFNEKAIAFVGATLTKDVPTYVKMEVLRDEDTDKRYVGMSITNNNDNYKTINHQSGNEVTLKPIKLNLKGSVNSSAFYRMICDIYGTTTMFTEDVYYNIEKVDDTVFILSPLVEQEAAVVLNEAETASEENKVEANVEMTAAEFVIQDNQ